MRLGRSQATRGSISLIIKLGNRSVGTKTSDRAHSRLFPQEFNLYDAQLTGAHPPSGRVRPLRGRKRGNPFRRRLPRRGLFDQPPLALDGFCQAGGERGNTTGPRLADRSRPVVDRAQSLIAPSGLDRIALTSAWSSRPRLASRRSSPRGLRWPLALRARRGAPFGLVSGFGWGSGLPPQIVLVAQSKLFVSDGDHHQRAERGDGRRSEDGGNAVGQRKSRHGAEIYDGSRRLGSPVSTSPVRTGRHRSQKTARRFFEFGPWPCRTGRWLRP